VAIVKGVVKDGGGSHLEVAFLLGAPPQRRVGPGGGAESSSLVKNLGSKRGTTSRTSVVIHFRKGGIGTKKEGEGGYGRFVKKKRMGLTEGHPL